MGESLRRLAHELCKPLQIHGWIGNGAYLIIGDVLHRRIKNQWGADIEVEVPTSPDKAEKVV
jgi:hypothetical protein